MYFVCWVLFGGGGSPLSLSRRTLLHVGRTAADMSATGVVIPIRLKTINQKKTKEGVQTNCLLYKLVMVVALVAVMLVLVVGWGSWLRRCVLHSISPIATMSWWCGCPYMSWVLQQLQTLRTSHQGLSSAPPERSSCTQLEMVLKIRNAADKSGPGDASIASHQVMHQQHHTLQCISSNICISISISNFTHCSASAATALVALIVVLLPC